MYPSIFSNDGVLTLQNNDIFLNKNYNFSSPPSTVKSQKTLKTSCASVSATTASATFEDRSKTNLIINYLPQSYDQEDLQCLFEQIGPIRQCKLIKDKITGTSLCYGFVDFVDPQHAALAIQSYHGYETEQKRLRVAYASSGNKKFSELSFNTSPGNIQPSNKTTSLSGQLSSMDINEIIGWEILVNGISPDKTEQDLCKMFNNFGKVLSVKMVSKYRDSKLNEINEVENVDFISSCKKILMARIIYEDRIAAETAVHTLNGMNIPDSQYALSVSIVGSVNRDSFFNRMATQNNNSNMISALGDFGFNNIGHGINVKNGFDLSCRPRNSLISKSMNFVPNQITRPIVRSKCEIQQQSQLPPNCQFSENNNNSFSNFPSSTNPLLAFQYQGGNNNQTRQMNHPTSHTSNSSHGIFNQSNQQSNLKSSLGNDHQSAYLPSSMGLSKPMKLAQRTQLMYSVPMTNYLNKNGFKAQVYLKLENLQLTGSFKIRGIEDLFSKIVQNKNKSIHLICPCPGLNRALTCVYCAFAYQISCTLVIPNHIEGILLHQIETFLNIDLTTSLINIISYGNSYNDCFIKAQSLVQEFNNNNNNNNNTIITNNDKKVNVMNGFTQGTNNNPNTLATINPSSVSCSNVKNSPSNLSPTNTSGLLSTEYRLVNIVDSPEVYSAYDAIVDEIISDLNNETPHVIVLPIGSGSLTAGIIQGLWNHNLTDVKIVTMEPDTCNLKSNCPSSINSSSSSTHSSDLHQQSRSSSFDRPNVGYMPKNFVSSLTCAPLSMETLQKVLYHPISCFTCSDIDALNSVKRFLNDHGMLVEPAAGVALSAVYNDNLARMRTENLLPDNAKIVMIITGGRDVSFDQLVDWEQQFGQIAATDHNQYSVASAIKNGLKKNDIIYDIQSNEINSLTTVNSVVDSLFSTNTPTKHDDNSNGSDSGLADPELTFTASTTKSVGSNNSSQILPIGHNRPQNQHQIHRSVHNQNPLDGDNLLDSQYDSSIGSHYLCSSNNANNNNHCSNNNNSNSTGTSSPLSVSTAASSIESSTNQCSSANSTQNHNDLTNGSFSLNNFEQFLNLKNLSEVN